MSVAFLMLALAQSAPPPERVAVEPGFELAGHRVIDADRDGRAELLVVGRDGRVRSFAPLEGSAVAGELTLPTPPRTLLGFAFYGEQGYLIAQSPAGTTAYPVLPGGVVSNEGQAWIPRGRFQLRLESPTFAAIVQDVNRDGLDDVVVPTLSGVELWLAALEQGKRAPSFRKAATVTVEVARWGAHDAEYLSDSLENSFSIPGLTTRDVNGDGRPDLLVEQDQRRAFHLQRADGSFPVEADVAVDLAIFRDTTQAAEFELGGTLSASDEASWASRDLDADGIPDYVIGHRRKVWVFRGGKGGPQFTQPSAILKTAEDITGLLVHELDADARPDLLLIKVQVPTLATLLRGLFGEWDVKIRALAYSNIGEGRFENAPSLSNELSLRLPGIVGLIKNPERILERFDELEKRFRDSARGDVDGDGREDVLLVTEDKRAVEAWIARPGESAVDRRSERKLKELLFDDTSAVWDIDRMLAALGGFAQRRAALLTGGRPADRRVPLRDPLEAQVVGLECADFGGAAGEELLVAYKRADQPRSGWFELLSFAGAK